MPARDIAVRIMEDCERRIIVDMLEQSGWNQTKRPSVSMFHSRR